MLQFGREEKESSGRVKQWKNKAWEMDTHSRPDRTHLGNNGHH